MSDLDAQGNVDYSNLPNFTVRGNSNATDIRRSVGSAPKFYNLGPMTIGVFQTIADVAGVASCVEGVEVIIHGGLGAPTFRTANYMIKLGGLTGAVSNDESNIFNINRNADDGQDPLGLSSERIFIPTTDLSKVAIGLKTNNISNLHTNATFATKVTVKIK